MGLSIVAIEMLKQKKKSLQLKQRITNKIEVELECWLEIYNLLNQNQIPFEIIYIACITGEEFPIWMDYLEELNSSGYNFNKDLLVIAENDIIPTAVQRLFPAKNNSHFHYIPNLEIVETQEYDFQKGLQSCISKINVSGKVVVFFGRVSPVIILPISDLLNIINNIDLPLYETIYLTDENFNWLIFCSHKQDWYAGYKT